mmetsp:Transcript_35017/g.77915  ORF Transcript_35017/g.77915 Transcript_35017/m.77915 type:complete len:484 (-) Transcript_35017:122-1573(-)
MIALQAYSQPPCTSASAVQSVSYTSIPCTRTPILRASETWTALQGPRYMQQPAGVVAAPQLKHMVFQSTGRHTPVVICSHLIVLVHLLQPPRVLLAGLEGRPDAQPLALLRLLLPHQLVVLLQNHTVSVQLGQQHLLPQKVLACRYEGDDPLVLVVDLAGVRGLVHVGPPPGRSVNQGGHQLIHPEAGVRQHALSCLVGGAHVAVVDQHGGQCGAEQQAADGAAQGPDAPVSKTVVVGARGCLCQVAVCEHQGGPLPDALAKRIRHRLHDPLVQGLHPVQVQAVHVQHHVNGLAPDVRSNLTQGRVVDGVPRLWVLQPARVNDLDAEALSGAATLNLAYEGRGDLCVCLQLEGAHTSHLLIQKAVDGGALAHAGLAQQQYSQLLLAHVLQLLQQLGHLLLFRQSLEARPWLCYLLLLFLLLFLLLSLLGLTLFFIIVYVLDHAILVLNGITINLLVLILVVLIILLLLYRIDDFGRHHCSIVL